MADYGQLKFGRRSTGLIHSASLFALKTGTMVAGFLGGWLLELFDFVPNQLQSEKSLRGILLMFSVIPAIFAIGKGISLFLYPLDRRRVAEVERELAARNLPEPAIHR